MSLNNCIPVKITSYSKTSGGIYVRVLMKDSREWWLLLETLEAIDSKLVAEFSRDYPDLIEYHRKTRYTPY